MEPSSVRVALAHALCLFSMALYAGNYVSMAIFNRYFSGLYFNIVRTIATIPLVPLMLACNSCLVQPKDDVVEEDEVKETLSCGCPATRSQIEESWTHVDGLCTISQNCGNPLLLTTASLDRLNSQAFEPDHPQSMMSDSCSTTPGAASVMASSAMLILPADGIANRLEDLPSNFERSQEALPAKGSVYVNHCTWFCPRAKFLDVPKQGRISAFFSAAFCLSSLSHYKLHPDARWPVLVSTVSGCVRQMIVPIALMFTTANAAGKHGGLSMRLMLCLSSTGIIQPAVPVFTAVVAILYGLEKFCWMTGVAIAFCVVGLFISEEGWRLDHIDTGDNGETVQSSR